MSYVTGRNNMRTTQFIGLSENAYNWLKSNVYIKSVREIAKEEYLKTLSCDWHTWKKAFDVAASIFGYVPDIPFVVDTTNTVEGMFGETVHYLREYVLIDGRIVEEYVQAEPWSSGPVIFLSLRYKDTKEIISEAMWTEDVINQY